MKPTIPENYFEDSWGTLSVAVESIYSDSGKAGASLEELYSLVDNLCSYKYSGRVYDALVEQLRAVHVRIGEGLAASLRGKDGDGVLAAVDEAYSNGCSHLVLVRQIFLVLDRSYVIAQPGSSSLWGTGLSLFRTHIFGDHPALLAAVVEAIVDGVTRQRKGEGVDGLRLVRLVQMMGSLRLYEEHLMGPFLDASAVFYAHEGATQLAALGLPGYLASVEARVEEETERLGAFRAMGSTGERLLGLVKDNLVRANVELMLEPSSFGALMDGPVLDALKRLYTLLRKVESIPALKAAFVGYLVRVGEGIVKDESKDKTMVRSLVELHNRAISVVSGPFASASELSYGMKEAFERVVNARTNRPAELIAKYMDKLLKSSAGKGSDEETLLASLDAGLALFQFVRGKDVFEAFYKKDLAKRLLLGKSTSMDAEKAMIGRLRDECGTGFSNKLEGMMRDIQLSSELHASWAETGVEAASNLYIHVLTMGFWPAYEDTPAALPLHLSSQLDSFTTFYNGMHSGRKLTWQHSLATVSLKAVLPDVGEKLLEVSLFQALVLLLFNSSDSLTFADIKTATQLPDKDLVRTLLSLSMGKPKTRVLVKTPKSKSINQEKDVFTLNAKLKNPLFRIKINMVQIKETKAEASAVKARVFQDRQCLIDAAIVRIMKSRKKLAHALLHAEVLKQVKFEVSNIDFKKRVESLIERAYLARVEGEMGVYQYLA